MSDRDNLGKGTTEEEMKAHIQHFWERGKQVRALVDETEAARTKLLGTIIAQNLDRQLIAESVALVEKALKVGFDPANTKWPPVVTTYLQPHSMMGHASILVEELFLDGQKTASSDQRIGLVNQVLNELVQKHGEPLCNMIITTLEELLKQVNRTLSTFERAMGLEAREFQEKTWYDYADHILPARDDIEYALVGLRIAGLEERLGNYRERLHRFDERLRMALLESSKKCNAASGKYDLTGRRLEYFPVTSWWRRLGMNRKGEPVWR